MGLIYANLLIMAFLAFSAGQNIETFGADTIFFLDIAFVIGCGVGIVLYCHAMQKKIELNKLDAMEMRRLLRAYHTENIWETGKRDDRIAIQAALDRAAAEERERES